MARAALCVLATLLLITGCSTTTQPTHPVAVKEVRPGMLAGYLATDALPDSLRLLPPPPAPGSAAFARDEEISKAALALRNTERWDQAIKDAELHFPAAASAFADAIGVRISKEATPFLYQLMRRTLADAGLSTYTAKNRYQRKRPFMLNGQPIGTPEEEDALRKDGSYPSGHTAVGWAWALLLTEMFPDKTDAILERGLEFGQSRVICNCHWQSDVDAGRLMGAGAVARLHANAAFRYDLERAREEARAVVGP